MTLRIRMFVAMTLSWGAAFCQNVESGMNSSLEHVVFFSGQVTLEDGSPPPGPVLIQRVCNGRARSETSTNSKGGFSFKVEAGENGATGGGDASQASAPPPDVGKPMGISSQSSHPITSALRDCEVQAVLAGFRADRVGIALKSILDNPRLPTIVLHPISRASSLTVSATTLAAPSNARKAYEKGVAAMNKEKWEAAASNLSNAVKIYPSFATAWYELGRADQKRNDLAAAAQAWEQALKADPKYVKPYEGLTLLADSKEQWAESEKYSRGWIQLDPDEFPAAYLFNAIANARLNRAADAEHAAREGLRIDKDRKVARLNYVLGLILLQKNDYSESVKCFRTYLELAPNAHDAPVVRQEIDRLEQTTANPH